MQSSEIASYLAMTVFLFNQITANKALNTLLNLSAVSASLIFPSPSIFDRIKGISKVASFNKFADSAP